MTYSHMVNIFKMSPIVVLLLSLSLAPWVAVGQSCLGDGDDQCWRSCLDQPGIHFWTYKALANMIDQLRQARIDAGDEVTGTVFFIDSATFTDNLAYQQILAAIAAITAPGGPGCNPILFIQYGESDGPFMSTGWQCLPDRCATAKALLKAEAAYETYIFDRLNQACDLASAIEGMDNLGNCTDVGKLFSVAFVNGIDQKTSGCKNLMDFRASVAISPAPKPHFFGPQTHVQMPSAIMGKWGAAQLLDCMWERCGCGESGDNDGLLPDPHDVLSLLEGKLRFFQEFTAKTFLELSWKGDWLINGIEALNKLLHNCQL